MNFWALFCAQCLMIEVFGLKSAIEHVIKSPPLAVPGNPVAALLTRSASLKINLRIRPTSIPQTGGLGSPYPEAQCRGGPFKVQGLLKLFISGSAIQPVFWELGCLELAPPVGDGLRRFWLGGLKTATAGSLGPQV